MRQRADSIEKEFHTFSDLFRETPSLSTLTQESQENHASEIVRWLAHIDSIAEDCRHMSQDSMVRILGAGMKSVKSLFGMGDDVTAWIGQSRLSEYAVDYVPGLHAAHHLATTARLCAYLYQSEEARGFLEQMRAHFTESDHQLAHQYWSLLGLSYRVNHEWELAIPCFERSIEHLEQCTDGEFSRWNDDTRNDHLASRNLLITDCFINRGWKSTGEEREKVSVKARIFLERALSLPRYQTAQYLTSLNVVEIDLLDGNLDAARRGIDGLLRWRTLTSNKAAVLQPGAYCMLARLAHLENNQIEMIAHLSTALAQSTLFPNALQEMQIVDFSLGLLQHYALSKENMIPIFKAMVSMLEAKDWYTGRNHSKSVAEMTLQLWKTWIPCRETAFESEEIFWAAYLHDIGKLLLPRSLLNKIAPISQKEWLLLKKHSEYGEKILTKIGFPSLAQLLREHHQDVQGNGYPGTEPASPAGLCIAVADIIEAATSASRKYKKPKPLETVISELRSEGPPHYPDDLITIASKLNINRIWDNMDS